MDIKFPVNVCKLCLVALDQFLLKLIFYRFLGVFWEKLVKMGCYC